MRFLLKFLVPMAVGVLWLACSHGHGAGDTSLPATLNTLQTQGVLPVLDTSPSLSGIDANANGVRDDVETLIAAQSDSAGQKASELQLAKALQATLLVDTTNAEATATVALNLNRGVTDIWSNYSSDVASGKVKWLQQITVNTMQRLTAYEDFNHAMDGTVIHVPKAVTSE
jgi:hypothetical protein